MKDLSNVVQEQNTGHELLPHRGIDGVYETIQVVLLPTGEGVASVAIVWLPEWSSEDRVRRRFLSF